MKPMIWRALVVSGSDERSHVWEPATKAGYPNAIRTVCKIGVIAGPEWLEPERASRRHCKRCERVLVKLKKDRAE